MGVYFGTIATRTVKHIYVANYSAFIITIAVLHIVNNLAIPVNWHLSYPIFSGAVDALTQWWYGYNAVGFSCSAGFLGMMYYFVQTSRCTFILIGYQSFISGRWSQLICGPVTMLITPHYLTGLSLWNSVFIDSTCTFLGRHD
jgi:cbb3-type cytochrome oxidase subunit 1